MTNKIIKPWGSEELLEVNSEYVMKRLYMKKGHQCSLQYHEEKSETNLEKSMDKYNRMMQLNLHIQEQYKAELKKIRKNDPNKKDPKAIMQKK